jgi:hypothetical protein
MEVDVVKEISELNNRDIIIVMDASKHWSDHAKSMDELKTLDLFYEIKVSELPKSNKGNKCYLSYNNKIYAWLEIYSITKKAKCVVIQMFPYINFIFPILISVSFTEEYRYFYRHKPEQ